MSDNFRIVHDPGPIEQWVYGDFGPGEQLIAVYDIVDSPRLGPIPVMSRKVETDLPAIEACRVYFGGNREKWMVDKAPTDRAGGRPSPAISYEEYKQQLRETYEVQRQSPVAPREIEPDDVLWDVNQLRDWLGLRMFSQTRPRQFREDLHLVSFPRAFPVYDRRWTELLIAYLEEFARKNDVELVDWEAVDFAIKTNNEIVFTILRQTRLTNAQYVQHYVNDVT
ncbi:hypothetical protein HDC94_001357 [Leifsonia sp. AK011]|uniref:hypothetical protein n=1 Tax=Leifsonia sp. AK011 TaxID=2723075 RepID=UPI0015CD5980|nr:hypothetical protein [Leifsonia sp. AK011]NYF10201.1 hypothetical protein [Leifsonia sp. AK011]